MFLTTPDIFSPSLESKGVGVGVCVCVCLFLTSNLLFEADMTISLKDLLGHLKDKLAKTEVQGQA